MTANKNSYTNTALATARRCLTEYDFRYEQLLESDGADSEALQVGSLWHLAHDLKHTGDRLDAYVAIEKHAPSLLWAEKLKRLFAAYHWRWHDEEFEVEESEKTFAITIDGVDYEGQLDGVLRLADGRRGIIERKTTSDSVEDNSALWGKLRMDVQTGLYATACGFVPSFILYDVVRKPTIDP